jgi:hypothetical protein
VGVRYAGVAALFEEDDESLFEPDDPDSFLGELDELSVDEDDDEESVFDDESPSDFFSEDVPLLEPERLSVL